MSDAKTGGVKPLFIPLYTKYFNAFADGSKTTELRECGPRWNAGTCAVGRKVVLSNGYGKHQRLSGVITAFEQRHGTMFGEPERTAIRDCFGYLDLWIAVIAVKLDEVQL